MKKLTYQNRLMLDAAGFTLLEAMIALLIFSIGLLGLAGLQASSLQNSKIADMRSVAIIAAHDMADRIRSNNNGANGIYNGIAGPASAATSCVTSTCNSSAEIEAWDAYEWETSLAQLLPPAGTGTVTVNGGVTAIRVMWNKPGNGGAGNCSVAPPTGMTCYELDLSL